MAFITLLAIAVGITSALGLVVVGLVEAPWQVLLLGLLAALYGLQRQIEASQSVAQASELEGAQAIASNVTPATPACPESAQASDENGSNPSDEGHELTYRGIRYRMTQPTPEASTPKVEGIYRGQRWRR
ncbi:MAG TPA: DUF4278 domain-containing protein [Nodosilinea sp.]|nr:DUF4278 domain-containing protein [Nodosilinea sp.]